MIDRARIQFPCPRCSFHNDATIKHIRLRDVLICRGCKANIQLEDQMNTVRVAERRIRKSIEELSESLKDLSTILTIKL